MADNGTTTRLLLTAIIDPTNENAWRDFDARYRPVIEGFARRLGLADPDAADIAQETLARFLRDYRLGKYDPRRARLRSWMIAIAKARIATLKESRAARVGWRGESAFGDLPAEEVLEKHWDKEADEAILQEGLQRLWETTKTDERTIQAFKMVVIDQRESNEVAKELGISLDSVYAAKHRCTAQLRTILQELNQLYDAD